MSSNVFKFLLLCKILNSICSYLSDIFHNLLVAFCEILFCEWFYSPDSNSWRSNWQKRWATSSATCWWNPTRGSTGSGAWPRGWASALASWWRHDEWRLTMTSRTRWRGRGGRKSSPCRVGFPICDYYYFWLLYPFLFHWCKCLACLLFAVESEKISLLIFNLWMQFTYFSTFYIFCLIDIFMCCPILKYLIKMVRRWHLYMQVAS